MAVYYDGQVLANQVAYAAIANFILKFIKSSKLIPFINNNTYWINRSLAIGLSIITTLGINYSYSYTKDGLFTLTLTGLTLNGMWESLKMFVFSYAVQQGGYHLAMKETYSSTEVK